MKTELKYQCWKQDKKGREQVSAEVFVTIEGEPLNVEEIMEGIPSLLDRKELPSERDKISWRRA